MLPRIYNEDDALGVRMDTLVEGRIEAENARAQLEDFNVVLDSLADDRNGIWSDEDRRRLRTMQQECRSMMEQLEGDKREINSELRQVKAEIEESNNE